MFDKLVASLPYLPKEVLEETFINGLRPWIKAEVECWEPVGLAQMMKLTQQVENREVKRSEIGFKAGTGDKTYINLPIVKANLPMLVNETK